MSDERQRALLDAFRAHRAPEPSRVDSSWKRLRDRLAGPNGGGGNGGGSHAPRPTYALAAVGGAVMVVLALALVFGRRHDAPARALADVDTLPLQPRSQVGSTPPRAVDVGTAAMNTAAVVPVPKPQPKAKPRPKRSTARATAKASRTRAASANPKPAEDHSVAAELKLIAETKRLLAAGRARAALKNTQRHARIFKHGALIDERKLMEMQALCSLGNRRQAQRKITKFVAAKPKAAITARVREACP